MVFSLPPLVSESERPLSGALDRKQDAAHRLVQLQRELRREQSRYARIDAQERKQETVVAMRKEMDTLVGKDLTRELMEVVPAPDSEMLALAVQLNSKLLTRDNPHNLAGELSSWYKVFQAIDIDHSGRISYSEFCGMVREKLQLKRSERNEDSLIGVWKRLDEDNSGYISVGEFGAFMRRGGAALVVQAGEKSEKVGWRERVQMQKRASAESVRAHTDHIAGRDVMRKLADVLPAAEAEMQAVASKLCRFAASQGRTWFSLFRECDADGSGRITLSEFGRLIRRRLTEEDPPSDELISRIWRALDKDRCTAVLEGGSAEVQCAA